MLNTDSNQIYEVYLRNKDGNTYYKPLREGLKEFLDPTKGYRLTLNIEGIKITLRNSWDLEQSLYVDSLLDDRVSIEVIATIDGSL